jgi:hypothetical protein
LGGLDDTVGPSEPTPADLAPSGEVRISNLADDLDTGQPLDLDAQQDPLGDSSHNSPNLPSGDIKDLWLQDHIHLDNLRLTVDFVKSLQQVTLGDPALGLSDDALECLCNPPHTPPCDAVNKIALMAIDLYMRNPLEETYKTNHMFVLQYFGTDLPLYYKVK